MPKRSKATQSRIKNLKANAQKSKQKQPSVTIEEVEDSGEFRLESSSNPRGITDQTERIGPEEGFIFKGKDGSLTLFGFLEDFNGDDSILDFVDEPDSDGEDDFQAGDDYTEIQELSDLEQFSKILAEAQQAAVEAENERLKGHNRPKHYFRNSARTKRRQKRVRKDLEKQGYHSIKSWFAKAKATNS